MSTIDLAIIICTAGRPQLLQRALDSLAKQTLDPARYEVIVVNDSGDSAMADIVCEKATEHQAIQVRVINSPRVGSAAARNRGVEATQASLLGFIDDDAQANPDWAERIIDLMLRTHPDADAAGGMIEPSYTDPKPAWFDDAWEVRSWGPVARALKPGESFSASNMVWRRGAFEKVGGFDESLGPRDGRFALGEETDLFLRRWALQPAPVFQYDPALRVSHWTPAGKMTVRYRLNRFFARGVSVGMMKRGHRLRRVALLVVSLVAVVVHLIVAVLRVPLIRPWQRWMVIALEGAAARAGMVAALIGMNPTMKQP